MSPEMSPEFPERPDATRPSAVDILAEFDNFASVYTTWWRTDGASVVTHDDRDYTQRHEIVVLSGGEPVRCYQCDELCVYLFADGRCKDCTRLTPDEVVGRDVPRATEL